MWCSGCFKKDIHSPSPRQLTSRRTGQRVVALSGTKFRPLPSAVGWQATEQALSGMPHESECLQAGQLRPVGFSTSLAGALVSVTVFMVVLLFVLPHGRRPVRLPWLGDALAPGESLSSSTFARSSGAASKVKYTSTLRPHHCGCTLSSLVRMLWVTKC